MFLCVCVWCSFEQINANRQMLWRLNWLAWCVSILNSMDAISSKAEWEDFRIEHGLIHVEITNWLTTEQMADLSEIFRQSLLHTHTHTQTFYLCYFQLI